MNDTDFRIITKRIIEKSKSPFVMEDDIINWFANEFKDVWEKAKRQQARESEKEFYIWLLDKDLDEHIPFHLKTEFKDN